MTTSRRGREFIISGEGIKLKPYKDSAGIPTIGIGTTYYPDGKPVTMSDKTITVEQAKFYLEYWIKTKIEPPLNRLLTIELNQNQYDALVSFVYNLGAGALRTSTLLKKVNVNPYDRSIRDEFMKWGNCKVNGKLTRIQGLVNRRKAEADLYFS